MYISYYAGENIKLFKESIIENNEVDKVKSILLISGYLSH